MSNLVADQSDYVADHKITVSWDDDGAQPVDFYSVKLYAINLETGVQRLVEEDLAWGHHDAIDRFAETNIDITYETYVVTTDINNNYVETFHEEITVLTVGDDYWLIHPTDKTQTVRLWHVTADSYSEEHENNTFNLIGRGRKVDTGETWGITGSLTAQLRDRPVPSARQQKIALNKIRDDKVALTLQTPFGDSWQVYLLDMSFARVAGSATSEFIDVTVPYEEVK